MEKIPEWALTEATKRLLNLNGADHFYDCVRILAEMIANHEKPIVDPISNALQNILKVWHCDDMDFSNILQCDEFAETLAQFKIELKAFGVSINA